ncbi:archaemetzincin-2-like [Acanthaster planci]|uniref:Archaemetzincin-2-like n=1 Tax=Acanthaster planci TaxID=133434 RepID=A0A8B7XVG7_ACAPL|nr:archaemetzincin-2-like [Acanthaster planci]
MLSPWFSCCSNTQEDRDRKNVKYLVHDLKTFEGNVQSLFELSAHCLSLSRSRRPTCNNDEVWEEAREGDSRINLESALFQHKSPVPMKGRQTYRMWKATVELSTGLVFKSDLLDKPKTLHFCPLERFPQPVTSGFRIQGYNLVQYLVHFLQVYFPNLDIRMESVHDINQDLELVSRYHSKTNKKQFLVTDLYAKLHKLTGIPSSDFVLGLTWTDLYPKEELNFVLGEASFRHRCAVLSFGRYEPLSYKRNQGDDEPEEESIAVDGDLLWKLLRVATHETCHLFGLNHCVFFNCSMNESTSVAEALAQPLILCPVCLRKIQRFLKFGIVERYRNLLSACQSLQDAYPSEGMQTTVDWLRRCMQFLS